MEWLFSIQISGETYCCSSDQPLTYSLPTCLWCSALPCFQLHCFALQSTLHIAKFVIALLWIGRHCKNYTELLSIALHCIAHCALRIAHCTLRIAHCAALNCTALHLGMQWICVRQVEHRVVQCMRWAAQCGDICINTDQSVHAETKLCYSAQISQHCIGGRGEVWAVNGIPGVATTMQSALLVHSNNKSKTLGNIRVQRIRNTKGCHQLFALQCTVLNSESKILWNTWMQSIRFPLLHCTLCQESKDNESSACEAQECKGWGRRHSACDPLCVLSLRMIYGIPRCPILYSPPRDNAAISSDSLMAQRGPWKRHTEGRWCVSV